MKYISLLFLFFSSTLHAVSSPAFNPNYSGTILQTASINAAPKQVFFQPYLYVTSVNKTYRSNGKLSDIPSYVTVNPALYMQVGILPKIDWMFYVPYSWTKTSYTTLSSVNDIQTALSYQISRQAPSYEGCDLRFSVTEVFPLGKFDHLTEAQTSTNGNGAGFFQTSFTLIYAKIYTLFPNHPFFLNLNAMYTPPTHSTVKGYSIYGGDETTEGRISQKNSYTFNIGWQLSLTETWAFATDVNYVYTGAVTFDGSTLQPVGSQHTEVLSFTPSIEYNQDANFSVLTGVWFSAWGKNTRAFVSPTLSLVFTF